MRDIHLAYFASSYIVQFIVEHPVLWPDRVLANTLGNRLTPSPAMGVFFDLLTFSNCLFTQKEYSDYAWSVWADWHRELSEGERFGVEARLWRNFYPSAIDSLHVWSLLVESGNFSQCVLSTASDAIGKTDLTVWTKQGKEIKIALRIGGDYSQGWSDYKRQRRNGYEGVIAIDLILPMERPRSPGNKRWYQPGDLEVLYQTSADIGI